jgi:hypothetical protein
MIRFYQHWFLYSELNYNGCTYIDPLHINTVSPESKSGHHSWSTGGFNISYSQLIKAGIATGYGLDDQGSEFKSSGSKNFHFSMSSRPTLRLTQPPVKWVPGAISLGVKRPGLEADHLQLVPSSRKRGSIHPLPRTSSCHSA